jgi:hypothetical protein
MSRPANVSSAFFSPDGNPLVVRPRKPWRAFRGSQEAFGLRSGQL